jgi:hypothetical protein
LNQPGGEDGAYDRGFANWQRGRAFGMSLRARDKIAFANFALNEAIQKPQEDRLDCFITVGTTLCVALNSSQ